MNTNGVVWRSRLRIIWTVAFKDIQEALKNKNTLTTIISLAFIVIMYRLVPIITSSNELPYLRVYAAEENSLLTSLKASDVFQVRTYSSEARMLEVLRNGDTPELGLVIPAGTDQSLGTGQTLTIQGYVVRWLSDTEATSLKNLLEESLSRQTARPVTLLLNRVELTPDSGGLGIWAGLSLVIVLVMVAISLVPHLMLEEKKNRTMDVLMVSPANAWELAAAKAVVGMFYSLVGAAVGLALYAHLVVHWGLALVVVLCGSFFAVVVGLGFGLIFNNRAQLTIWSWAVVVPLTIPIFLALEADLLPPLVGQVSRAIPTVVMFNLLRSSFANPIDWGQSLAGAAYVIAWGLLMLGVVAWLLGRLDREGETAVSGISGWLGSVFNKFRGRQNPETSLQPEEIEISQSSEETQVFIRGEQVSETPRGMNIILAVFAKDLREIVKNKLAVSILIGSVLLIVPSLLMPALSRADQNPLAMVVDEGHSVIINDLISSQSVRLAQVQNLSDLEVAISQSSRVILGLVIPADFDQKMQAGEPVRIAGYAVHWADPKQVAEWADYYAQKIGQAGSSSVAIETGEHWVYPSAEGTGNLNMTALLIVIVVFTIGIALVPLLIMEEKEGHTLDAILVSPANLTQLVLGKALAGSVYCLIAAGVVLAVNYYLVVNWGVVLLAVLLTTIFTVAIGLLVGVVSNNPTTVGLWSFLGLVLMVAMIFAHFYTNPAWPGLVRGILNWLPGSLMIQLFRFSLAGSFPVEKLWATSFALVGMAGLLLAGVGLLIWRVVNR